MKLTKLNIRGFSHHFLMMFVVLLVGVGGTFYLVLSHADTPTASSSTQSSCFGNNCTAASGTSTNSTTQAAATAAPTGSISCSANTTDITLTTSWSNTAAGVYIYQNGSLLDSSTSTSGSGHLSAAKSVVAGTTYSFVISTRSSTPQQLNSVQCATKPSTTAPTSTSTAPTTTTSTGTTSQTTSTTSSTGPSGSLNCLSNTTDITLSYSYTNAPAGVYFYRDTGHLATDSTPANTTAHSSAIPGQSSLSPGVSNYTAGHTYLYEMKTRDTNKSLDTCSVALKPATTSTNTSTSSGTTTGTTSTTTSPTGTQTTSSSSDGLINCTFLDASGKAVTERHTPSWCEAKRAAQIATGKLIDTNTCSSVFGAGARFYSDLKVCATPTASACPTGTKVAALKSGTQTVYTCVKDTGSTVATEKCVFLDAKGKKVSETHTVAWCDAKHELQHIDGHGDKYASCKLLDEATGKLITEDHTVGYCTSMQARQHISATGMKLELCKLTAADGTELTPEYHNPGWCASRQKQIDADKPAAVVTDNHKANDPPKKTTLANCVWVDTAGNKHTTSVTSYTPNQDCQDKSDKARATKVTCVYSDGGHTQAAHEVTNAYLCATSYGGKSTKIVTASAAPKTTSGTTYYNCTYLATDGKTKTVKTPSASVCNTDYVSDAKTNRIYCIYAAGSKHTYTNTYNCIKNIGGILAKAPTVSYCHYYDRHENSNIVEQITGTLTSTYCTGTLHGTVVTKST